MKTPFLENLLLCLPVLLLPGSSPPSTGSVELDKVIQAPYEKWEGMIAPRLPLFNMDCGDALKKVNNSWANPPEADRAGTHVRAPSPHLTAWDNPTPTGFIRLWRAHPQTSGQIRERHPQLPHRSSVPGR
jgi:hypothetical protein